MYSHNDIWQAIDRLAKTFGYSASGLAKQAGLDPTTFNKSKRHSADGKPRWPSTESIAKILSVTGMTMAEFFSLADESVIARAKGHRTVPITELANAANKNYFNEKGYPAGKNWEQQALPPAGYQGDHNSYALKINDNSLAPLYRAEDILIVSPDSNIRLGDRVVIKTRKGDLIVREIIKNTDTQIILKALTPQGEDTELFPKDIEWKARIIWASQ